MIDIHAHILWGLDDGPTRIEESLAMLDAAAADGTTDIVATPHSDSQYRYDVLLVDSRIQDLVALRAAPRIHRGCELHLTYDNLEQALGRDAAAYTIAGGQYLLLECPDVQIPAQTGAALQRLLQAGVTPILAHPERNPVLQSSLTTLSGWVELGCLIQVTALSITGAFGSSSRAAAMRFLDLGLVHIVASDTHDPERRHPRLSPAREAVRRRSGDAAAELLFTNNPSAVIENRPISPGRTEIRKPRRWWHSLHVFG